MDQGGLLIQPQFFLTLAFRKQYMSDGLNDNIEALSRAAESVLRFEVPDPFSSAQINDPSELRARGFLHRGYARTDEILINSFDGQRPKGLHPVLDNPTIVRLFDLVTHVETQMDLPLEETRDLQNRSIGFAHSDANGGLIAVNRFLAIDLPASKGQTLVNSTIAHEAIHTVQRQEAPGTIDWKKTTSDALVRTVSKNVYNPDLLYNADPHELQARMHQIMMRGHHEWGQLPTNKEELFVSLKNAGLNVPERVMATFKGSATIENTQARFKVINAPTSATLDQMNLVIDKIPKKDQVKFWGEAVPKMYSDLIEKYGDGPDAEGRPSGRERFGLGENEYFKHRVNGIVDDYMRVTQLDQDAVQKISGGEVIGLPIDKDQTATFIKRGIIAGNVAEIRAEINERIAHARAISEYNAVSPATGVNAYEQFERIYDLGGTEAVERFNKITLYNKLVLVADRKRGDNPNQSSFKVSLSSEKALDQVKSILDKKGITFDLDETGKVVKITDQNNIFPGLKPITSDPVLSIAKGEDSPVVSKRNLDTRTNLIKEPIPDDYETRAQLRADIEQRIRFDFQVKDIHLGDTQLKVLAEQEMRTRGADAHAAENQPRMSSDVAASQTDSLSFKLADDSVGTPPAVNDTSEVKPNISSRFNVAAGAAGVAMGGMVLTNAIARGDAAQTAVSSADVGLGLGNIALDFAPGISAGVKAAAVKLNIGVMVVDGALQVSREDELENKVKRGAAVASTAGASFGTMAAVNAAGAGIAGAGTAAAITVAAPMVAAIAVGGIANAAVNAGKATEEVESRITAYEQPEKIDNAHEESGAPALVNYKNLKMFTMLEGQLPEGVNELSSQERAAFVNEHSFSQDPATLDALEEGLQAKIEHYDRIIEENDSVVPDSLRWISDDEVEAARDAKAARAPYVAAQAELSEYRQEISEHQTNELFKSIEEYDFTGSLATFSGDCALASDMRDTGLKVDPSIITAINAPDVSQNNMPIPQM